MNPEYQTVFSRVEGVPFWGENHWRIELYDTSGMGWLSHPIAAAYVNNTAPEFGGPSLDYLIVFDQYRGQECVKPLMRAIHERWPDVWHTERLAADGGFRGENAACGKSPTENPQP